MRGGRRWPWAAAAAAWAMASSVAVVAATATARGYRRTIVAGSAPAASTDVNGGGRRLVLLRRCGWAGIVMVVTPGGGLGLPAARGGASGCVESLLLVDLRR
jgi:hypothetical protein